VTGRQGRRCRKLLDDLKERRGYSHLKDEALDRTMWRARFGRGFGPAVRQTTKWMNKYIYIYIYIYTYHICWSKHLTDPLPPAPSLPVSKPILWVKSTTWSITRHFKFATECMCSVCVHKKTPVIFLHNINLLYFIVVTGCILSGVEGEYLCVIFVVCQPLPFWRNVGTWVSTLLLKQFYFQLQH
jgi:hypothetical protein